MEEAVFGSVEIGPSADYEKKHARNDESEKASSVNRVFNKVLFAKRRGSADSTPASTDPTLENYVSLTESGDSIEEQESIVRGRNSKQKTPTDTEQLVQDQHLVKDRKRAFSINLFD